MVCLPMPELLKKRKIWVAILLFWLAVVPVSLAYLAWLTDVQWWESDDWNDDHNDDEDHIDLSYEYVEHFKAEVTDNVCPARPGKQLKDYWACLWASSITAEGTRQHKRILADNFFEHQNLEREVMEKWYNSTLNRDGVKQRSKGRRVRRAVSQENKAYWRRADAFLYDTWYPYEVNRRRDDPSLVRRLKECQQDIFPGVSIQKFLLCVRKTAIGSTKDGAGSSFNSSFAPSTYPYINYSTYADKDFQLIKMTNGSSTYDFRVDFEPLSDEEKLSNFHGADPYLEDNWSVYRYKYDNMNVRQQQPGWSYGGSDPPKDWHKLNLERFYLPLIKTVDLTGDVLVSEFAQTYPAIGEIAENVGSLKTPLEYRWSKDSGYSMYTRYLLPLLQTDDLGYYKSKGLISPELKQDSDAKQIQDIIDALGNFTTSSDNWVVDYKDNGNDRVDNPDFPNDVDVPNYEAYLQFLSHFFNIDIGKYIDIKNELVKEPDFLVDFPYVKADLKFELEIARRMLRAYVGAVKTQEACVKAMVEKEEYRLDDDEEVKRLLNHAKTTTGCLTANTFDEAVKPKEINGKVDLDDFEYKVTDDNLRKLYDYYFDRKEARERYSLPKFPVEFPICKHNEPSPIDIQTDRGRKSSLQDYVFGDAAYRLNRFFMFFPLDASPLLTVGIVNGERLDDSSVRLTGGAVKGQNLTFQYMHIRFSSDWKRVGSEHRIDGRGTPMELQMVFTIAGSADPIKYWHVLARVQNQLFQFREKLVIILSVLVDVLETEDAVERKIADENLHQDPNFMEPLAQAAYQFRSMPHLYPNYEEPRGYVSLDPVFRFIDFIPRKSSNFYTYRGSLSWPPCFGYVIWSVYKQQLYISKRQFDQFRQIPAFGTEDDNFARNNFRKYEDVYVEEEDDPTLTNAQIEVMKRKRTIDRHVLIGWHEVKANGEEQDDDGIVGEEMYNYNTDGSADVRAGIKGMSLTIFLVIVQSSAWN